MPVNRLKQALPAITAAIEDVSHLTERPVRPEIIFIWNVLDRIASSSNQFRVPGLVHVPIPIEITAYGEALLPARDFLIALGETDVRRIRRCLNCNILLWAGRIDQWCCTRRCANAARVRKHRAKPPGPGGPA